MSAMDRDHFMGKWLVLTIAMLIGGPVASFAIAEDWGAYELVPASAPALVLEAVGSGTTEGTVVSIGNRRPRPIRNG